MDKERRIWVSRDVDELLPWLKTVVSAWGVPTGDVGGVAVHRPGEEPFPRWLREVLESGELDQIEDEYQRESALRLEGMVWPVSVRISESKARGGRYEITLPAEALALRLIPSKRSGRGPREDRAVFHVPHESVFEIWRADDWIRSGRQLIDNGEL